jgi:hypothetical protein
MPLPSLMVTRDAVRRPVELDAAQRTAAGEQQARAGTSTPWPTIAAACMAWFCCLPSRIIFSVAFSLLDAVHRADLRQLRGHLRVVHRVERILVLQLRGEQLEEAVLRRRWRRTVALVCERR